jgi:hypothetical protein
MPPSVERTPLSASAAVGVGHPEQAGAAVRRRNARSRQIGGPDGISCSFQVSANSPEPFTSILARNLLSKDDCRAALGDEAVKRGPEVSFVGMALSLSCDRKRLTGTAACPHFAIIWPLSETESVRPAAEASEEMDLTIASQVFRSNVPDVSIVNVSIWE